MAVDFKNAPLVFVGYGVSAPERKWDDFKGVDLKGKLAVVLINDPDFDTGRGAFGGKAMTYYGRWTYKFEEMARRGAVGTLIVHETAPASYGWDTVKNSNTNVMYDVVRKEPAKSHAPMEAWIQRDLATALFKRAGLDFEAARKQARTRGFKPVELKGQTLSAQYAVDAQVINSKNVVARIDGSAQPNQYVMYSGHWDHLGVGLADAKGDTIYNGAVDNATGISALLEMARAYAGRPAPKRSVVFMALTAEERGLMGSEYYAANPLYPLGSTVGVINMDALSPYGPARNFSLSGSAKQELLDRLVATAKKWKVRFSPDPKPEAGHFFRSDHFPFAKRGVPAISFQSGEDLIDGGVVKVWRTKKRTRRTITTSRLMNSIQAGRSPAWRATWKSCLPSATTWPIRPPGRPGPRIRNSAPHATRAQPNASNSTALHQASLRAGFFRAAGGGRGRHRYHLVFARRAARVKTR
ncbi:M28 family metallopeptidase [Massilia sp. B-10]|nr:M28 family metallopeptidase [Massilia sp. B-10]